MPPDFNVFISYSHDSDEHRERVWQLARDLRQRGVAAELDQYHETMPPPHGWPLWMERAIQAADFVLVVCTADYLRRWNGEKVGKGVTWEAVIARDHLFSRAPHNTKFIPVLFEGATQDDIPTPLRSTTRRSLPNDFVKLFAQITGQHQRPVDPVGPLLVLPVQSSDSNAPPSDPEAKPKPRSEPAPSRPRLVENYTVPGLKMIRDALDGGPEEIKAAIVKAQLFRRVTTRGNPQLNPSVGEEVLVLFSLIATRESSAALEDCRKLSLRLFGEQATEEGVLPQMRFMIDAALRLAEPPNPFVSTLGKMALGEPVGLAPLPPGRVKLEAAIERLTVRLRAQPSLNVAQMALTVNLLDGVYRRAIGLMRWRGVRIHVIPGSLEEDGFDLNVAGPFYERGIRVDLSYDSIVDAYLGSLSTGAPAISLRLNLRLITNDTNDAIDLLPLK